MATDSIKMFYRPGQIVPTAGIYKVVHAGHRLPHKARFLAREKFPLCSKCTALVRFELLLAVKDEEENSNSRDGGESDVRKTGSS
jgi:hypothetical protein